MMNKLALVDADSIAYIAATKLMWMESTNHIDMTMYEIKQATGCREPIPFVEAWDGDKNIFRKHVAVSRPYKQRKPFDGQERLAKCKEYLVERYGAHITWYLESEDKVRILANKCGIGNVVMCAIDKDLLQQHGTFYDYSKKDLFSITEDEAVVNFWRQMVTGDSIDSIPGLPRKGKKHFEKLTDGLPVADIPNAVCVSYAEQGMPWEYIVEQGRLLYILKHANDVWLPPITREEYEQHG